LVALAGTHEAQAALTFLQLAVARANIALNSAILKDVPIASRLSLDRLIHLAFGLI
jgi:hypothetical protein